MVQHRCLSAQDRSLESKDLRTPPGRVMVQTEAISSLKSQGLCVGAALAFWGRSFAASWIQDPPAGRVGPIGFGAVAMIAVALVAAYGPARVDPMEALRHE